MSQQCFAVFAKFLFCFLGQDGGRVIRLIPFGFPHARRTLEHSGLEVVVQLFPARMQNFRAFIKRESLQLASTEAVPADIFIPLLLRILEGRRKKARFYSTSQHLGGW